ncbi:MAG: hypothetical protein H6Q71_1480 [Firmicutes bacterium]|nr:hypothetical protein [Bacillota bacterium]
MNCNYECKDEEQKAELEYNAKRKKRLERNGEIAADEVLPILAKKNLTYIDAKEVLEAAITLLDINCHL